MHRAQVTKLIREVIASERPDPQFFDVGAFVPNITNGNTGSFALVQVLNLVPLLGVTGVLQQSTRLNQSVLMEKILLNQRVNMTGSPGATLSATKMRVVVFVVTGWDGRNFAPTPAELFDSAAISNGFGSLSPFNWENVRGKSTGRHHSDAGYIRILYDKSWTLSTSSPGASGDSVEVVLHDLPTTFVEDTTPPGLPSLPAILDNAVFVACISDDPAPPNPQYEFHSRLIFRNS